MKCPFVVENAEFSGERHLALVSKSGTVLILRIAGMSIVKETNPHLTHHLHNGSYKRGPHFGMRTTYVFPKWAIKEHVKFFA
jgi:hypothetical protein